MTFMLITNVYMVFPEHLGFVDVDDFTKGEKMTPFIEYLTPVNVVILLFVLLCVLCVFIIKKGLLKEHKILHYVVTYLDIGDKEVEIKAVSTERVYFYQNKDFEGYDIIGNLDDVNMAYRIEGIEKEKLLISYKNIIDIRNVYRTEK